jgi:hypothetical protein
LSSLAELVHPFEVADQFRGDPSTGLAGAVAVPDLGQECFSLGGREVLLRAARNQLQQQQ